MKITLNDKEVREALEHYVVRKHMEDTFTAIVDVHVIQITRHHGGTVSAVVSADTK